MYLREGFMTTESAHTMNIAIRYIAYAATGALFYVLYECSKDRLVTDSADPRVVEFMYDGLLSLSVLILASGDLINLMEQYYVPDSMKLGLSVLWGVFSLAFIALGIRKGKKHLRIGGIVLMGITLGKLFLYDIADLPTIPKTILFISIGILMLIVSFLYTKYKFVIFGVPAEGEEL
jgi:uncharacterized membrane protein